MKVRHKTLTDLIRESILEEVDLIMDDDYGPFIRPSRSSGPLTASGVVQALAVPRDDVIDLFNLPEGRVYVAIKPKAFAGHSTDEGFYVSLTFNWWEASS